MPVLQATFNNVSTTPPFPFMTARCRVVYPSCKEVCHIRVVLACCVGVRTVNQTHRQKKEKRTKGYGLLSQAHTHTHTHERNLSSRQKNTSNTHTITSFRALLDLKATYTSSLTPHTLASKQCFRHTLMPLIDHQLQHRPTRSLSLSL